MKARCVMMCPCPPVCLGVASGVRKALFPSLSESFGFWFLTPSSCRCLRAGVRKEFGSSLPNSGSACLLVVAWFWVGRDEGFWLLLYVFVALITCLFTVTCLLVCLLVIGVSATHDHSAMAYIDAFCVGFTLV